MLTMAEKYPFLDIAKVNAPYADRMRQAAMRVIESGRHIGGEEVDRFNAMLAGICHTPVAVGVSNGLDALRLIFEGYKCLGMLSEGDEVIIPANTYIASVLAVSHAGLKPVFADPDITTMNLSSDGIRSHLTERTKAVMPVHLYGRVAWDSEMLNICRERSLLVIEDAAQAIGAESSADGMFSSKKAGAIGHAGAISFYPTKNIGAVGDAGAVVTHDARLADAIKALANYGSDRRYHNIYQGFNCRLDPIQAALLCVKLADIDHITQQRRDNADAYRQAINNPLIIKPGHTSGSAWHQYVIRVTDNNRDRFRSFMATNGIATDVHYATPPYAQPCYKGVFKESYPNADRLSSEVVSLPISSATSVNDIRRIADTINQFS